VVWWVEFDPNGLAPGLLSGSLKELGKSTALRQRLVLSDPCSAKRGAGQAQHPLAD